MAQGLDWLNSLSHEEAEAELLKCCGSTAWACAVAARRPFAEEEQLLSAADDVWSNLEADDWLEAFSRHPKIGERKSPTAQSAQEQSWSRHEQSRAGGTDESERALLAELNREYERKFGHIFIVCAAGKGTAEILASLKSRIGNDAAAEVKNAAEEQRQITRLRLRKLLEA
ncbi:MAG: 2-oxo-4-hydroxy-4-carboxy-5-ureidoimidazoline decarboxylase [Acidobacteriota bacterium]|nr:2-oxo-4-hydroxy-4-carboxy-5-ureidoimidazoline decarboxylase [Acidobacteriota bacterium]